MYDGEKDIGDRMVRDGALQIRRTDADTLIPTRTHERMDQYYKGVRVFGGDVTRQTAGGLTVSIFGTHYADIALDVTPALSAADAAAVAAETGTL